jgi:hypothetical protein
MKKEVKAKSVAKKSYFADRVKKILELHNKRMEEMNNG